MSSVAYRVAISVALAAALFLVWMNLAVGMHRSPGSSVSEILILNGFFVALFVLSAPLFQRAALEHI